jgi:hypothetical protein
MSVLLVLALLGCNIRECSPMEGSGPSHDGIERKIASGSLHGGACVSFIKLHGWGELGLATLGEARRHWIGHDDDDGVR